MNFHLLLHEVQLYASCHEYFSDTLTLLESLLRNLTISTAFETA